MNRLTSRFNFCTANVITATSLVASLLWLSPAVALEYATADQSFDIRLRGRLHYDYNDYNDVFNADSNGDNDSRWFARRSRLAVQGQFLTDFEYKVQWNLGMDSRRNASKGGTFDSLYLRYKGIDNLVITVGQHKEPFGMEQLISSNNITAIERSAPIQLFAPGKTIGATVLAKLDKFTWAVNYTDEGMDGEDELARAYSTRLTFSPVHDSGDVVHLGVAYTDRKGDETRARVRPELRDMDSAARISSGNFDSDAFKAASAELALAKSRWHLQGEYFVGTYEGRDAAMDYDVDGWYVQTGYFLTADVRNYSFSKGVFSGIKPQNPYGALELFARYSEIDLEDNNQGNSGNITTVGFNWYINKYFRTGINVVHADYNNPVNGEDDGTAIAARVQFAF